MSKPVNRTTVDHAHAVWPDFWEVVPATDYDALAQRCRELEEERDRQARLVGREICRAGLITKERDTLRAEVERLRQALRNVVTAAGGATAPDVSTEFLEQASIEVLAMRGKHERLLERLLAVVTHPHENKEALANRVRQILESSR